MTNLKKVGFTALAGSLVAVSAHAGSLAVTGGAEMSYTSMETNASITNNPTSTQLNANGSRFGLEKFISFTGSGELDNGHTISLFHGGPAGSFSSSTLTYDMGDMGSLTYHDATQDIGIGKIDDLMPSAYEEPWDGIDFTSGTAGSGVIGRVDSGQTGFNYTNSFGMATVMVGYAPSGAYSHKDDGGISGVGALEAHTASTPSSQSIAIQADVMDGLMVFAGTGDKGGDTATTEYEDDHTTMGFKYTMGALTFGYQNSSIDDNNGDATDKDTDTDAIGIAFAVNENLSVSYGYQETELGTGNSDQELTGYAVGYSMGGMSIKAQRNEADRAVATGAVGQTVKRTEILVGFAF